MRARVALLIALVAGGYLAYHFRHELLRGPDRSAGESEVAPRPPPPPPEPAIPRTPVIGPEGAELTVELIGLPAAQYAGRQADDDADETYRALVEALDRSDVVYDRDLSRAASEVAYQAAVLGKPPPEAAMTFLMHACGAPELSARQFVVHTNVETPRALREAIERATEQLPAGEGPTRVGVGEVSTPDEKHTRHIAVLLSRRPYEIAPTPRFAPPGAAWTLRGALPPGYEDLAAAALYPDGRLEEVAVERAGREFAITVQTGSIEGELAVGLSGTGPGGPGKVLQLTVAVSREPPRSATVLVPPDDPAFADVAAAEAHALALLNGDRERFGLEPLVADETLGAVARAHSEDMRDAGYFGHRSPTTGMSSDRLAAAGYRSRRSAENIALNDSLAEAEASLLGSIGHRQNILDPRLTRVGVGLAQRRDGGHTEWYLTQQFATPVDDVDPSRAADELLGAINRARGEAGRRALRADAGLTAVARRHAARAAAAENVDAVAEQIGQELRLVDDRAAAISVHAVHDLAAFSPPPAMLEEKMTAVGVGVIQSADDLHGRIGIVLIAAAGDG